MLKPVRHRPNLEVFEESVVTKIIPNRGVGNTVTFIRNNELHTVLVLKEVIVSAGAYGSPKLLQQSGIGDCDYLSTLDIECVYNNTDVGSHLKEIIIATMAFVSLTPPVQPVPGAIMVNYYKSSQYTGEGTDMELAFTSLKSGGVPLVVFQLSQLKHSDVGFLKLKSKSPFIQPFFTTNIWKNETNIAPFVEQFHLVRSLMNKTAHNYNMQFLEVSPGLSVVPQDASYDQIVSFLKTKIIAGIHTTGTCGMHRVVNDKLEIFGLKNVRVIDNSIIPTEMSSHSTSSTATLIGKVGSRFILEKWN